MRRLAGIAMVLLLACWTCAPGLAKSGPEHLNHKALKNAAYALQHAPGATVKLTDGKYEDRASGVAVEMRKLIDGDLDSDGWPDAVALLVTRGPGEAVFYELVAVLNRKGSPVPIKTLELRDCAKVNALVVRAGMVIVDMVAPDPDAPSSFPSLPLVKTFELRGDHLEDVMSPR